MRILIVEDDVYVARYVQKGLQAEHFAVDLVSDGVEAQNLAVENDYDLLILDVGISGGATVFRSCGSSASTNLSFR